MSNSSDNQENNNMALWNLSVWKINLIGGLLTKATEEYQKGRLVSCFFAWKSIVNLFNNRLSKEEIDKLRILESKAFSNKNKRQIFTKYLDEYSYNINIYLKKYGMDIADKEFDDMIRV